MKIAIIINISMEPHNGIKIQAETWAKELEIKGHEVYRISPWESYDWTKFDIIHLIGSSRYLYLTCCNLNKRGIYNIVLSPIIDSNKSHFIHRMSTYLGCMRLHLFSGNYIMRKSAPMIRIWNVRTQTEADYLSFCYGVPKEKISIIPLSYRINAPSDLPKKEIFCLHVSRLSDSNKNVHRLVLAAEKYKFSLKLAGTIIDLKSFKPTMEIINRCDNIEYVGTVSDEELCNLYCRAQVFALPSISEGVGMVALEAACYGCNIVVTNVGGPKEYYGDLARTVNPMDVDDIGLKILDALNDSDSNRRIQKYVQHNYNLSTCVDMLVDSYKSLLK